jgi:hypothetical protein
MKRDLTNDTDPTPAADAVTEPTAAPGAGFESTSREVRALDPELDPKTARILKALDRPPRPPAPTPEQRPSSDGGDFVAYSSPPRSPGAPPRTDEECRRQALAQLSALIQESPATDTPSHVSTRTVAPGSRVRTPTWPLALLAVVVVASVALVWVSSTVRRTATQQALQVVPALSTPAALPAQETLVPLPPPDIIATGPVAPATPAPDRLPTPPVVAVAPPHGLPRSPPRPAVTVHREPLPVASGPSAPDGLIEHPW